MTRDELSALALLVVDTPLEFDLAAFQARHPTASASRAMKPTATYRLGAPQLSTAMEWDFSHLDGALVAIRWSATFKDVDHGVRAYSHLEQEISVLLQRHPTRSAYAGVKGKKSLMTATWKRRASDALTLSVGQPRARSVERLVCLCRDVCQPNITIRRPLLRAEGLTAE